MSKQIKWFSLVISMMCAMVFSFATMASSTNGLFSAANFKALKNDPATMLSKTNACRLKAILGEKDFKQFDETMSQMSNNDDAPDFISISGNEKGLFTIMEGYVRLSKAGKIWLAYLHEGKVYYFTNDEASLKQAPKIMQDWSSRFKEAKWVDHPLLSIKPDNCK